MGCGVGDLRRGRSWARGVKGGGPRWTEEEEEEVRPAGKAETVGGRGFCPLSSLREATGRPEKLREDPRSYGKTRKGARLRRCVFSQGEPAGGQRGAVKMLEVQVLKVSEREAPWLGR